MLVFRQSIFQNDTDLHTLYTLQRHLVNSNNKYKFKDFNMKSIYLFSFFLNQTYDSKVSRIGIRCYLPQNTYICGAFSKTHIAVLACCAGLYTEHFSIEHAA